MLFPNPHRVHDRRSYKAQRSRSINVNLCLIRRLQGSSIIHARKCWTDWIVAIRSRRESWARGSLLLQGFVEAHIQPASISLVLVSRWPVTSMWKRRGWWKIILTVLAFCVCYCGFWNECDYRYIYCNLPKCNSFVGVITSTGNISTTVSLSLPLSLQCRRWWMFLQGRGKCIINSGRRKLTE